MSNTPSTSGEASSNKHAIAASQSMTQNTTSNPSSQGRGRGGRNGRWTPMALTPNAFTSAPSLPAQSRPRGNTNASRGQGGANRQQYQQPRNTQIRNIPSTTLPMHIPARQVIGMNPVSEAGPATASTGPSGKKNRRQRGRGMNQTVATPTVKKTTTFRDLPFELRERIMSEAYAMTLAELPDSVPHVTNDPLDMSREAAQRSLRGPAAITRLRNSRPPPGLTNKQRKAYLWRNPGQWGPIFQVMYANKQLYEEASRIRYREIHIKASISQYDLQTNNDNVLMNRLRNPVIQDHTKYVIVEILHRQSTVTIKNLVEALAKLKSLKHLCLVVRSCHAWAFSDWSPENPGTDNDLLMFFGLNIESLDMRWIWSNNNPFDLEPNEFFRSDGTTFYSTVAEIRLGDCQSNWLKDTYKPSSWYKDPESEEKVLPGKVEKHISKTCEDKFFFGLADDMKPTVCPNWVLRPKNPHNHPDQLVTS